MNAKELVKLYAIRKNSLKDKDPEDVRVKRKQARSMTLESFTYIEIELRFKQVAEIECLIDRLSDDSRTFFFKVVGLVMADNFKVSKAILAKQLGVSRFKIDKLFAELDSLLSDV